MYQLHLTIASQCPWQLSQLIIPPKEEKNAVVVVYQVCAKVAYESSVIPYGAHGRAPLPYP